MSKRIKEIALFTVICFIWGMVLPTFVQARGPERPERNVSAVGEQSSTSQEDVPARVTVKANNSSGIVEVPGEKKTKKKFPWLWVGLGTAAAVVAIVLLTGKKEETPDPTVQIDMVQINGGTFQMGSNSSEATSWEKPVHSVTLSTFFIGKYEVTQGQWRSVMGSNPSFMASGDNYPVEQVSWDDVQLFIQKLNQMTGRTYRLPTEAEWEYAARGGTTGDRYGSLDSIAWHSGNSGGAHHPVGQKQPNSYGLYDMLGNIGEWCQDWYEAYTSASKSNPKGPAAGTYRVLRGGAWINSADRCSAARRNTNPPDTRHKSFGLRLAMNGR